MITPVVSIIIATYNSSSTIREALMSVQEQLFQDWECIIVDGASKDNTIDIVKEYEAKDSRFRHISEPDNGIYDAFNKGWKIAKGEWIYYLGSDDQLTNNSFIELIKHSNPNADVISGACYILHKNGRTTIQKSVRWGGCHQAKITRRSTLEKYNGFDTSYRIIADADLYERIKNGNGKVVNVDSPVAYFSMDGTSQKFSNIRRKYVEFFRIYEINIYNITPIFKWSIMYIRALLAFVYRKVI